MEKIHSGCNKERSENFGFKSSLTPSQNMYLTPFKNDLYMVCNIEFKTGQNEFQKSLMSDLNKTRIDKKTRKLSKHLKLDNKMECYAERHAFITLKDHKEKFKQNTKCRLINPAKGDRGRVSIR